VVDARASKNVALGQERGVGRPIMIGMMRDGQNNLLVWRA